MLLALTFAVAATGLGLAVLRVLRLPRRPTDIGLAPAAGLALGAAAATWLATFGFPPIVGTVLLGLMSLGGFAWTLGPPDRVRATLLSARDERLGWGLLAAALVGTCAITAFSLGGFVTPLSPHDGAQHVEMIEAFRHGARWDGWYPAGLHVAFAVLLQVAPAVDSAQGAYQVSLGLILLAPLAAFGFAWSVWRNVTVAGAGALLLALTFQYPYQPHLWSGWPLAMGLILVLGLWTTALAYLAAPRLSWAVLGAVQLGAMLLVHGTELYTTVLGLAFIAAASWRRVRWAHLWAHLALGALGAILVAAPYLPSLIGFARSGHAAEVGQAEGLATTGTAVEQLNGDMLVLVGRTFGTGVELDLPVRLMLLLIGLWWAFGRREGRFLVGIGLLFLLLAVAFTYSTLPLVQQLSAATFPWGQRYRLLMVTALTASLLQGAGAVAVAHSLAHLRARRSLPPDLLRIVVSGRMRRLAAVLSGSLVLGSAWSLVMLLLLSGRAYNAFTDDDAAAMAWLRGHVRSGEIVVNDSFADAGIWAPQKSGVEILVSRLGHQDRWAARKLVLGNVARLEAVPEARAAACAFGVRYVYRGAAVSAWNERLFPPLEELRGSSALEIVFESGRATVFRTHLSCPS